VKPTATTIAASIRAWAAGAPMSLASSLLDQLEPKFYLLLGQYLDYTGRWSYRGSYAAGTAYVNGDVVEGGGVWYVSNASQTGVAPPGATWDAIPSGGGGGGTLDHAALTTGGHLAWTSSAHTGTASRLAGFDGAGATTTYQIGTAAGTVAAGDHLHGGVYQPAGSYQAASSQLTALAALAPAAQYQVPMSGAGPGFAWGLGTLGSAAFTASGDYQAADADLTTIAGLARVRGNIMVANATPEWALLAPTARGLLTCGPAATPDPSWLAPTAGGLLVCSAGADPTPSWLAAGTAGYPLLGGGAGTPPAYGQVQVGGMYASATSRVFGRKTAGAGTAEELVLGTGGDVAAAANALHLPVPTPTAAGTFLQWTGAAYVWGAASLILTIAGPQYDLCPEVVLDLSSFAPAAIAGGT
jgi:hypothetical protein